MIEKIFTIVFSKLFGGNKELVEYIKKENEDLKKLNDRLTNQQSLKKENEDLKKQVEDLTTHIMKKVKKRGGRKS